MVKNPLSLDAKATHKYDDIIQMDYPLKGSDLIKHPRMRVEDRAKIFAPFAALKGYEEAIAAKQKCGTSHGIIGGNEGIFRPAAGQNRTAANERTAPDY